MPLEIERKFLLADDRWRRELTRRCVMRQGYLGGIEGRASMRVRVQQDAAYLNIKAAVIGAARAEYEYGIPLAEAQEILDGLCVGVIDKTRHYVERDGFIWEIDEFAGDNAGLVVAEIELVDASQGFPRPAWLGREVTDERRYYNHSLALNPYTAWVGS
ncbi:MAG: CYTH domain-containing protein [Panacagrimonas sp.]